MEELHKKPEESMADIPHEPETPVASIPSEVGVTKEGDGTALVAATSRKKYIILAVVVAVLLALGYYFYSENVAGTGPVAVVNGFKIAREEFNSSVEMIQQTASLQGANLEDPEVKNAINEQALDILVNNALLLKGAEDAGIVVDEARINEEYGKLVAELGGEETLRTRMEEVGLSEEKLRSNIEDRILVDSYLESETDVENIAITDEEVEAFYESLKAGGGEGLPTLEELRSQIEDQIRGQKQQTIVNDFLMKLRENADIDIKI